MNQKNYTLTKLSQKIEKEHAIATAIRRTLKTLFLEAVEKSGKKYIGLYEMGEIYMEQPYNFRIGMSLSEFRDNLKSIISKETSLDIFYHENIEGLYNMSVSLYKFRAYRDVLISKLNILDYNYFNAEEL